ncbi:MULTISPECIES: Ku protein [Brevibacillus]|uniref:Non-homologous end joining protein Ku n=1 Tax=Brevibacillus parabrevis TaxID=54914 RepID=A0A4Y3PEA3_BREPA|nr:MULTISPECIES: Ku protein [Brevibacillus]MBU8711478.1 Ku protein [Brevibacillus parabrevis]NRQ53577.1 Ku protein [Brevibacillus sp. HD1.4A]RNB94224.1 Ku protein [Brevibacillus parabrevis]WDV93305.1 Ku protein [Brevibacillus parabrevis]GEB31015.1 non-homologous end joining protein Ku [Brevibacillus parabrevis]
MHTVWKGSISFGLVNIPVRMFTATEERDIRFRQLHKECNTPIKYTKMCPHCQREVDASEIVRGYEYEKGHFVMINDEDLEAITPETRRAIEILDFVDLSEIDPVYFDKSYFLSPQDTGEKAYALLRAAMGQTGKIAIAQVTMRNRQSLAVIRLYEHCMMLETIFYPDEVRPVNQVPALPEATIPLAENELKMATELIGNMTVPFDPAKYTDEYRSELQKMIEKKLEGQEIATAPTVARTNVIDLMQALKESLASTAGTSPNPVKIEPEPTPAAAKPKPSRKRATPAEPTAAAPKQMPAQSEAMTTTKKLRRKKATPV